MGTVYNRTTEPEASRRLPSFLSRFFPDGSRRPGPAMGNRPVYNRTTEPQASRRLPSFFLRCFPAGNRQPSPARQNRPAYNQTTEPQASRYLPSFFLRCFPAGNRQPSPARASGSAYKPTAQREAKTPRPPPLCFRFCPAGSRRPGAAMENGGVYNPTTEPQAKAARRRPLGCTLRRLRGWRLPVKAAQTIFSLVAVVCEEVVDDCITCGGLYFFEFISCSAFLLSLLILYVYCTDFYESLGEETVKKLVFGFFATFAFAAEFVRDLYELCRKRKQNIVGRPQNPRSTPSATENRPLNKR